MPQPLSRPLVPLVSWALAAGVVAYLATCSLGLFPVLTLTDRKSWAWEITAFGFFLKVAQDNRKKVADLYWAKALVCNAIAAFGGGFLAPMIVGRTPVPLMEETFVWMVVVTWYITHNIPHFSDFLGEVLREGPGRTMLSIFFGIFKTQQIVGAVELASKAVAAEDLLPKSAYFPFAVAAPLLCGFVGGCGGAFLPPSSGLAPIEEGKVWNIRAAFFAPLMYVIATRFCGVDLLTAKLGICLFRIAGELFPSQRDAIMESVTSVLYNGSNVRSTPLPTVVPVKKA
mmetsp:Transcript_89275/g.224505  ORF Transcript_89275/g.224505 Transcript_89275/m.224505 type:complete len:285 (+) Transcript_89275:54-908(+)